MGSPPPSQKVAKTKLDDPILDNEIEKHIFTFRWEFLDLQNYIWNKQKLNEVFNKIVFDFINLQERTWSF